MNQIMNQIKMQEPYQLSQLVAIFADAIIAQGLDRSLDYEDTWFCLYTKGNVEFAYADLICYLDDDPDVNEEDQEIYPDFVVNEELEIFYSGGQFEDVIHNVLHQKSKPSMEEFIKGLNYYKEHDDFLDL